MKKKIKVLVIALLFLLCTGCSETIKDGKEVVTNKETGQTLTSNILCKPNNMYLLTIMSTTTCSVVIKNSLKIFV